MIRFIMVTFLIGLVGCSSYPTRHPSSIESDDPCHSAMKSLFDRVASRNTSESSQFVDEVIDRERLLESGKLSEHDFSAIENSKAWQDYFLESKVNASRDEEVLVAALLRHAEPDAPVEALQRKYRLLFEFCGL